VEKKYSATKEDTFQLQEVSVLFRQTLVEYIYPCQGQELRQKGVPYHKLDEEGCIYPETERIIQQSLTCQTQ